MLVLTINIDVFLNRVYLFDDGTARFIFNAGANQVDITDKLLAEIVTGLKSLTADNSNDNMGLVLGSYNADLGPPRRKI